MKLKDLKDRSEEIKGLLQRQAVPNSILKELKIDFGGDFNAFPKELKDAYQKYSDTYYELQKISAKLGSQLKDAEEKGMSGESEIKLPVEIDNYGIDDFFQFRSQLQRSYANLQLTRNEEFRTKKDSDVISTDTVTNTERIVFTSQDLSESFLTKLQKETQQVLSILNHPFDKQRMNEGLKSIDADALISEGENSNHLGTSSQHRKDYTRGLYVFESDKAFSSLPEELKTGDYVVDDLEKIVQAYLKRNELGQDAAPNVRALITTLLTQGVGLPGQMYVKFETNFFHFGSRNDFAHTQEVDQASVFFDSETGKLRFETYIERSYNMINEEKVTPEQAEASKLFGKLSMEIDMERDASGNTILNAGSPTFTANKPDFNFAIVRNSDFAKAYPILFNKDDFNERSQLDEKSIDSLRPYLNDMAKFGGYASLTALFNEEYPGESQFKLEKRAAYAKFNDSFLGKINSDDTEVQSFFKEASENFYGKGKSADELSKDILSFVDEHLSQVPDDQKKLQYIHLLKMGESLSSDEKHEEYRQKAGKILSDNKVMQLLAKELAASDLKEGAVMNETIKEKLDFAVNCLDLDSQKVVEILCRNPNSKEALLAASRLNENIYQEIVQPKTTLSYVFRKIGEFFGTVEPRPEFTPEEHKILIQQHYDVLKDEREDNPYREKLAQLPAKDKLSFLCAYVGNADNSKHLERLGDKFFEKLDNNLKKIIDSRGEENKEIRGSIFKSLDELAGKNNSDFFNPVVAKIPKLFAEYARDCSNSKDLFSSTERMLKIAQLCDDQNNKILMKNNPGFFVKLVGNLTVVAKTDIKDPNLGAAEKAAIENIKSIIQKDKKFEPLLKEIFEGETKSKSNYSLPITAEEFPNKIIADVEKASAHVKNDIKKIEPSITAVEASVKEAALSTNVENKNPSDSNVPPISITPR